MSNSGVFDVNDIRYHMDYQQWATFGELQLIETQTISSATADFTALQETTYNVHLFTFTDIHFGIQTELGYKLFLVVQ